MSNIINDEDIELKLVDMDDVDAIFNSVDSNREYLRKYLPWIDDTNSVRDTMLFVKNSQNKNKSNNGFDSGIWYKGEFAGMIGFHEIDKRIKSISIGYWLDENFVGRGIMTYACNQFVRYAFNILKMNRVEIRCVEDNLKSIAIPERIGFTKEGIIRDGEMLYGEYLDCVVYGLLRRDKMETT